jgi:hypothetical protein
MEKSDLLPAVPSITESEPLSDSAVILLQTQLKAERAKSSSLYEELTRARFETTRLARLIDEEEEAIANRLLRRNAELVARGAAVQQSLEAESENVANLLSRQLLNVQREKSAMEKAVQDERTRISALETRLLSAQRDKEEALAQASGAAASLRLVVHSSNENLKRELVEAERRSEAETESVVLRLQRQQSFLWATAQAAEAQAKSVHEGWLRLVHSFLEKLPNDEASSSSSSNLLETSTTTSVTNMSSCPVNLFKSLEEASTALRAEVTRATISLAPSSLSIPLSVPHSPSSNSGALSPGSPFPRIGSSRSGGGGGGRIGIGQVHHISSASSASSRASSVGPMISSPIGISAFPPPSPDTRSNFNYRLPSTSRVAARFDGDEELNARRLSSASEQRFRSLSEQLDVDVSHRSASTSTSVSITSSNIVKGEG